MRKVTLIGVIAVLGLSLVITGTILAQDGRDRNGTTTTWLGVSVAETEDGVVVARVSTDSPAAAGGLLVDDVIVSVDDQAIESADALTDIIRAHEPGDVVAISVLRDGSENTFEIELGTTSGRQRGDTIAADADPLVMAERVLRVELAVVDDGYQVLDSRIRPEDTLSVDDVITAVNGTPVTEVDWQTLLTELADQDNPVLTLTVLRDGEEITVDVERFGSFGGPGSMGEHGRFNRDNSNRPDQFGHSNDSGFGIGNAPHSVEPGMTCDQCHGDSTDTGPNQDDSVDSTTT